MCDVIDEDLISSIKTIIVDLKSEELFRRKAALTKLKSEIFPENIEFSQATYPAAFAECQMHVLKCLRDKSEMNRDLAIQIMSKFIQHLELNDYYLTYIFPVIVERIGTVELIEESEEIRLDLVNLMITIINRYFTSECLVPFLSDIVQILCQTVVDGYPKIKEASCNCIINLAKALPKHFHMQCENLVKPVIKSFTHQHFRIRLIAVKTIGVIILHSTGSDIINNTVTSLAERLFDQNSLIRKEVGIVAGQLLLEYRDRYSFFHRILPLILTPLSDEVLEVRQEIQKIWFQVGEQYMKENEKDFKDQLDFPISTPTNYPSHLARPNLGCRALVQRNATKMSIGVSAELSSWQEDIRIRCSQLLCVIVLHCEENVTQGLQDLLPAMYTACEFQRDQQKIVLENVMLAAKYIGIFVPVKVWSALVIPATKDSPTCGHLRILRSMISGALPSDLHQISVEVGDLLILESVRCSNRKPVFLNELVECSRTLINCPEVSSQIFTVLVTVVALGGPGRGAGEEIVVADGARELLAQIENPEKHVKILLDTLINENATFGSAVSTDRCIFDTLLHEWSIPLMPHLSTVGAILMRALDDKCDAETRLKTFEALSRFLQNETLSTIMSTDDNKAQVASYMVVLIKGILLPALVWRAGRTAEALRTAASFCLNKAFQYAPKSLISSEEAFNEILSTLITLTDDASPRTRIYGSRCLSDLGKLLENDKTIQKKWANEASVALVKRLDDPNDAVRYQTMICLKNIMDYPNLLIHVNLKFVVDAVLTHFDDEDMDKEVASVVLEVLQTIARTNTTYMKEKVEKSKHFFRNKEGLEKLVTFLDELHLK